LVKKDSDFTTEARRTLRREKFYEILSSLCVLSVCGEYSSSFGCGSATLGYCAPVPASARHRVAIGARHRICVTIYSALMAVKQSRAKRLLTTRRGENKLGTNSSDSGEK